MNNVEKLALVDALAEMLGSSPVEATAKILQNAIAHQMVSLNDVTGRGVPLWVAYLKVYKEGSKMNVPALEALEHVAPGWWNQEYEGLSAFQIAADNFLEPRGNSEAAMSWFVKKVPLSVMKGYKGSTYGHDCDILDKSLECSAYKVVQSILEKSEVEWNTIEGNKVVRIIKTPAIWEMFLAQGGNPLRMVNIEENKQEALWLIMLRKANNGYQKEEKLSNLVTQWMEENCVKDIEQSRLKQYWKSLECYRPVENLKKNKDWPNIIDEKGRTPMMVIVQRDMQSIKAFMDIQKAKKGLQKYDNKGRSLWYYVFQNGASLYTYSKWLKRNVPMQMDNVGNGLLGQLSLSEDNPTRRRDWFNSIDSVIRAGSWEKNPEWYWGDNGSQKKMLLDLTPFYDPDLLADPVLLAVIQELLNTPSDFFKSMDPEFLGFGGLLLISESLGNKNKELPIDRMECIENLIEAGALMPQSVGVDLEAISNRKEFLILKSGMEKNLLSTMVDASKMKKIAEGKMRL